MRGRRLGSSAGSGERRSYEGERPLVSKLANDTIFVSFSEWELPCGKVIDSEFYAIWLCLRIPEELGALPVEDFSIIVREGTC